ncbi:putative transketolase N-terminal section [Candidatus Promineifilum breve]|uniref:Transketolase N-terminal section n=1 Tax=Candidatus Promineifilum breve TaxID=1806508 RepID=A0A160T503_9CHLR|nr:thiamine pyrophosphate-dependent enzyme [Candidatus Promineifilum breve]CUS05236.2 putative transketolase N-terminal section [Candidatus Promineifilum breve]
MNREEQTELENMALRVREHIIRLSTDGGCFTGASLSCADLIVYLYNRFLNVGPHNFDAADRDYLFLSKGHDVPALYGTFVELGWLPRERLANHLKTNDTIYWHPNRNVPGIEFHSGSLGHLPAVAVGVALDCKMRGLSNRIVVITGDGELNEGSVWEALLVANAHKLDNLLFIVDRNHFQANVRTEDLIPLEPLAPKFEAFGCRVRRVDGHDFAALEEGLADLLADTTPGKAGPRVLIADTVRGRGLPSIQERADRWFCNFTHDEVAALLDELHGARRAEIESEALMVR